MKLSHWVMAGFVALALGCSGAAFANHEKGHEEGYHKGGGKWRHGGPGCDMSPEKRELIHIAMHKAHKDGEALEKQVRDRHGAMEKVLAAKKFDPQAFLNVYDELAALDAQKKRNMAAAFAEIAGKLSPEERKKCAMFLAGGMHHRGMRGRHHGGGEGGWGHHRGHGGPEKYGHHQPAETSPEASKPSGDWGSLNK